MIVAIVVAGVALVISAVVVMAYNRFVRQLQLIDNAWANVESELQRRYDLIPNLVETVKGYATHERTTFEAVTQARTQAAASEGTPANQAADENVLVGTLKSLLAVSEAYPDLQANQGFLDLQAQLTTTEDRIQAARRFYNNNVRDYNTRVQSVPTNLVAKAAKFSEREYFEIDLAVAEGPAPSISFES